MQVQVVSSLSDRLPVSHKLTLVYTLSFVVALLLTAASAVGLLYQSTVYPTEELRQSFVANDLVNLFVGLPILLGSMWLARRGRLVGLLFWPGALFYVFYNAIAYTFALPVNEAFVLNLVLGTMAAYTTIALVAIVDAQAVRQQLAGVAPERLAGGVLMGLGVLFILFVISALAEALINQTPVTISDRALHVADSMTAPAWVIGGLLLWRRQALGYVTGVGLLFQGSMLFVGAIAVLLLQPLLTATPLQVGDIVVLAIMGLVCFIPFALFVRAVVLQGRLS